jgi:hypothetical protein
MYKSKKEWQRKSNKGQVQAYQRKAPHFKSKSRLYGLPENYSKKVKSVIQ